MNDIVYEKVGDSVSDLIEYLKTIPPSHRWYADYDGELVICSADDVKPLIIITEKTEQS